VIETRVTRGKIAIQVINALVWTDGALGVAVGAGDIGVERDTVMFLSIVGGLGGGGTTSAKLGDVVPITWF
jgi:hypothetical protein